MEYLRKIFSLLRVFKEGNIGLREVFIEHRFSALDGLLNNICRQTNNLLINILDNTTYTLSPEEIISCNQFLREYSGQEYQLLKSCIKEFVNGLKQIDIPTGFEQYTTALEMILLDKNQRGKKEPLSKRVAVLLESDPFRVRALYDTMNNFYRYRSDSLHEGDGKNISAIELKEMEEIVRKALLKYLEFCKTALRNNPNVTWDEIKNNKINELKEKVRSAKSAGTLPE